MARKPNENCLEGVACPKCGQEHRFNIAALVMVEVTDNGTEDMNGSYEWDGASPCHCTEYDCQFSGTLADFTIENWSEEKRAWLDKLREDDDEE